MMEQSRLRSEDLHAVFSVIYHWRFWLSFDRYVDQLASSDVILNNSVAYDRDFDQFTLL